MAEHSDNRIVVVAGPTATGKTETAIELALQIGGEIVCADSMQIYKTLNIGTAKPTPEEMEKVPHHLYSFLEPSERYSVAQYLKDASGVIREIRSRGKIPIVCGGTGLYISTLLDGVCFDDVQPDLALREEIRREIDTQGAAALLAELAAADPDYAASLHENDTRRIVRAVELLRTVGYTIPEQNEKNRQGRENDSYFAVLSDNNRDRLYQRIEQRVDQMIKDGLLTEAAYVHLNRAAFLTAAQAIGYKEFFGYFEHAESLEDCVQRLKQATRNYAKRQLTWFRREVDAVWYDVGENPPGVIAGYLYSDIKKEKKKRMKGATT